MKVDWFHKTESRHFDPNQAGTPYQFEAPEEATLEEILDLGYELGIPKGSARAGCFEIQTDKGIWQSHNGGRMDPARATFKSWEQLEAED